MASRTHIGIGLGVFAFIVFVVGFGAPYWTYASKGGGSANQGLWKICNSITGCIDIVGSKILKPADWFKAVQALECLAFIAGAAGLGLSILPLMMSDQRGTFLKGAMGAYIAAAVLGIIGAIIFGVKQEHYLHFAYAFTIIGSVFFGAAGVILGSASTE